MAMFAGKIGLVMGVANDRSIAWAISEALYAEGAELAFTHLPSPSNERRVRELVVPRGPKVVLPCNVQSDADVARVFDTIHDVYGRLDFLVHSIAFAPPQELRNPYAQMSREGWHLAMDISVYSLVAVCRRRRAADDRRRLDHHHQLLRRREGDPRLQRDGRVQGGAGTQRALPRLGPRPAERPRQLPQRRADAHAQRGGHCRLRRPPRARRPEVALERTVDPKDVGATALYLLGDLSSGVTGESIHVDCGYSIVGL